MGAGVVKVRLWLPVGGPFTVLAPDASVTLAPGGVPFRAEDGREIGRIIAVLRPSDDRRMIEVEAEVDDPSALLG